MYTIPLHRFYSDVEKIRSRVARPDVPNQYLMDTDFCQEWINTVAVIELNDVWAHFCRSVIGLSASGNFRTRSGIIVTTPSPRNFADAIDHVRTRRGYEPRWHDATQSIQAATRLQLSNAPTIQLALGSANSPASDLNACRNYFAHKRSNCAEVLRNRRFYRTQMKLQPFRIVNHIRRDGRSTIDFWMDELKLIADAALS